MNSNAKLWMDAAPPESGVRRITRPAQRPAPAPRAASPALAAEEAEIWKEVGEQVFLEVWDLMLALQPLQGAWLRSALGQMGTIAARMLGWNLDEASEAGAPGPRLAKTLRERWPELVPGHAAMDRLMGLMVDWICRQPRQRFTHRAGTRPGR